MKMRKRRPASASTYGRFARDESGATVIEYGLIVSLIFLAILSAVNNFADRSNLMYENIQSALTN